MNKFSFASHFIARIPAFPFTESPLDGWEALKPLIEESSPEFYTIVRDYQPAEIQRLEDKKKFTLWKYFNRALYRGTPFGHFASVSLLPLTLTPAPSQPVQLESEMITRSFTDWSEHKRARREARLSGLQPNSSMYRVASEIRFAKLVDGYFHLSSLNWHTLIEEIMEYARPGCSLEAMESFLAGKGMDEQEGKEFIEELLELQLLTGNTQVNAIGTDYFWRTGYRPQQNKRYTLALRQGQTGQLNQQPFQDLLELAAFLQRNLSRDETASLTRFKEKFKQKYEQRFVPLLQALDPEHGIGYDALEQSVHQDSLVSRLKENAVPAAVKPATLKLDALTLYLLNHLGKKEIELSDFEENGDPQPGRVANSFSAIAELIDGTLWLKSMGGVSATSLLGRFSPACSDIHSFAKSIADYEAKANPGVIFFDIGYQGDEQVGNVNRRAEIYPHELPLLCWSESKERIELNQVLIGLQEDQLVLYSSRYKKRLVPRLASAYNYGRSDFSVYRCLADMQAQGLLVSLQLQLDKLLPGLDYYPALRFKNVLVSPAQWRLSGRFHTADEIRHHLLQLGVSPYFKTNRGDQFLFYSMDSDTDLEALLQFAASQQGSFYVQQAQLPSQASFIDERQRPYVGEMQLIVQQPATLYRPLEPALLSQISFPQEKAFFLPAQEWLYYQVYCPEYKSDALLLRISEALLDRFPCDILKWFFIRYPHPRPHIRFRFLLASPQKAAEILSYLNQVFAAGIEQGEIQEVRLETYERELQRYGTFGMERVEDFFHLDSQLVLELLAAGSAEEFGLYALCAERVKAMLLPVFPEASRQLAFVRRMAAGFHREFNLETRAFKQINAGYSAFRSAGNGPKGGITPSRLKQWTASFTTLLEGQDSRFQEKLAADLIHMHVNRVFSSNQRLHELTLYEFLGKDLQRKLHQQRAL